MPHLTSPDHGATVDFLRGLEAGTKSIPDGVPRFAGAMQFQGYGGQYGYGTYGLGLLLPGSDYDYQTQAGDLWRNSAVAACLRVLKANFPQPELIVRTRGAGGRRRTIAGHPLVRLIDRPNPAYDRYAFWAGFVLSAVVDGNAFALKIRSRAGIPVQLWWVPPWQLIPRWLPDGTEYIGWYEYRVNGRTFAVRPRDVIHFRHGGIDPRNDRLALSELKAAGARGVCSLNEADGYTASLLRNGGVPNVAIEPIGDVRPPTRDQADRIKEDWRELTTGERRGDPFVPAGPFKVTPIGFTPEQLALDKIPARLEDQICSLTGVNPMVAGLTSANGVKTYANYETARRAFYEDTLVPLQAAVAECIEHQLLGDAGIGDPESEEVAFSYEGIPCLQEDQDRIWTRAGTAYKNGLIKRSEGKQMVGLPADASDEVYFGAQPAAAAPAGPDEAEDPDDAAEGRDDGFPSLKALVAAWREMRRGRRRIGPTVKGRRPKGTAPKSSGSGAPAGSPGGPNCGVGHHGFLPGNRCARRARHGRDKRRERRRIAASDEHRKFLEAQQRGRHKLRSQLNGERTALQEKFKDRTDSREARQARREQRADHRVRVENLRADQHLAHVGFLQNHRKLEGLRKRSLNEKRRRFADKQERLIGHFLRGRWMRDYEPMDVIVKGRNGRGDHAIEVKSLLYGKSKGISIRACALVRKIDDAAANHRNYHTIVIDRRGVFLKNAKDQQSSSGYTIYYKRGCQSASLSSMYKVKDLAELEKLIHMPYDKLPEAARGGFPTDPDVLADIRKRGAKQKEYNDERSKVRKDKKRDQK